MRSLRDAVHAIVAAIPAGQVMTYGEIAAEAGFAGAARAVGGIMASADGELPWWRVVAADGRLVPGLEAEHERLLRGEAVVVLGGRVAMAAARRSRTGPRPTPEAGPEPGA